jgi:hypothetical protein
MRSMAYGKLLFALYAPWGPEDAATRCTKTLRNCGHFRSVACLEFRPWQHTWGFMRSSSSIWIGILIGSTIGGLIPGLWGDGVLLLVSSIAEWCWCFCGAVGRI